ncbi:Glucuronate isomerase [Enterobacter hormaechei]|nr:Glucuronate isomerase [Enterobacter hormaechei]
MSFINDNFMIGNARGVELYRNVAKALPIIDYHCHLDAKDIFENKNLDNIAELWLAGDHYKWRAMRANGIDEKYITGDARRRINLRHGLKRSKRAMEIRSITGLI